MQRFAGAAKAGGKRIAFIPTMGYLHEGHISLVREGCKHGDEVVVSIFVNPAQFGPAEDLGAYPRAFERDRDMAGEAGATVIFAPETSVIYGENFQTYVQLDKLPNHLCGLSRPGHFRGVATVVAKLFNIVKPDTAIFGQKDYQQLLVIRQMVKDLNFDIRIIGAPIVREPDGLAMSSRNTYLNPLERQKALCLYQSLQTGRRMTESGMKDSAGIIEAARKLIAEHPEADIDYITVCDPDTLEPLNIIDRPALMALAVKIGNTRLIDNMILQGKP